MVNLYKNQAVKISDLDTRITFFSSTPSDGPEPGENNDVIVYSCWARIDSVWMKDLEQAKSNGTLEDLTLKIRDTRGEFIPTNKHHVSIDKINYVGKKYNVKFAQSDPRDKRFTQIVAGLES